MTAAFKFIKRKCVINFRIMSYCFKTPISVSDFIIISEYFHQDRRDFELKARAFSKEEFE